MQWQRKEQMVGIAERVKRKVKAQKPREVNANVV